VPYSCDVSARSREKKSGVESVRVETPSGERVYQREATSGMGFRGEVHVRIASRLWGMGKRRVQKLLGVHSPLSF